MKETDDEATFSGPSFSVRVDKKAGLLQQYRYRGVTLLERGPRPDFWREPTNNDRGAWKVFSRGASNNKSIDIELWREAGPRWEVKDVQVKAGETSATVTVEAALPVVGASYTMTYTIHGSGEIDVESSYKPGSEKLAMM